MGFLLTLDYASVNLGTSQVRYRTCAAVLALESARYKQLMATMMAPVEQREVLRCDHCSLVQFRTANALCRRCHKCLEVEEPEPAPAPLALVPTPVTVEGGLQVATAVRDLRHVRNLSQRQLAARMGVPRTYISKIENGKAMPTLSSLDRLAKALQVDISTLLRDSNTRHRDETAVLMTDPFLAEIAMYTSQLDDLQRSIFLNHVRELAAGRRRTA
jgi:transcriptional regulator with XRE-family HTH domain